MSAGIMLMAISAGVATAGFASTCIVLAVRHAHRQGRIEGEMGTLISRDECENKHIRVEAELKDGAICMTRLNGKIETLTQITKRQDAAVDRFERLLEKNGG